ncbi:class I adenylate-forming enzyme family protein [Nocardioides sp. NPDC051685]|uniref:class I adenylate-forming enzyme family protein n=1 Tax=Nocardioides sp. NPDC051685 TaxID=3364334 RepID=UPI00378EDE22
MDIDYLPWTKSAADEERICLRDEERELTYAEVSRRSAAVAEQFAEAGIGRGDVVAIMLPNRLELLIGLFAAWRLGATATPINPVFTPNEAGYQIKDSGATLLLTVAADAEYGIPVITADELSHTHATPSDPSVAPDALALLIYTSGSTGRPKGVMLDHANLVAMITSLVDAMGVGREDHSLLVLPLFHVNALVVSCLMPLFVGGRVTVLERFAPTTFLDAITRHRPTYFSAVPTIYARLAEQPEDLPVDTTSVRFAACGSSPVAPELLKRIHQRFGFPIVEGYGLTEGTCASTFNPADGSGKPRTVGRALPGQEVGVMSPEGELLGTGVRGEVVIRGANVMRGYLGRPEATEETIVHGWLHTGDVGVIDDDGYLTIVDRIKDMIIRGGENLYPKEIESVLTRHPEVLEAAVVGAPEPFLGEVPVAYVVTYPDATVTVDELIALCRVELTKIKVPTALHLVQALPKNPIGKIDKPALRQGLSEPTR